MTWKKEDIQISKHLYCCSSASPSLGVGISIACDGVTYVTSIEGAALQLWLHESAKVTRSSCTSPKVTSKNLVIRVYIRDVVRRVLWLAYLNLSGTPTFAAVLASCRPCLASELLKHQRCCRWWNIMGLPILSTVQKCTLKCMELPRFLWRRGRQGDALRTHDAQGSLHANSAGNRPTTWSIIAVSKWLVTLIYKPFRPFGRGTTLLRRLINHGYFPLTSHGMILQVCHGLWEIEDIQGYPGVLWLNKLNLAEFVCWCCFGESQEADRTSFLW